MTTLRDIIAENILKRLSDLENYPDETLSPYEEFSVEGRTYYFTPDAFLYRKETPEAEEEEEEEEVVVVGDLLCGYLTDEVWRYRTDERFRSALRPVMRLRRLLLSESGLGGR
jgi:hypothetical protein